MPKPPLTIYLGDLVQLRKPHACGGDTWSVVRLGAEIGMRCTTCQHKVLLPRSEFERRVKRFVSRGAAADQSDPLVTDQAEGQAGV